MADASSDIERLMRKARERFPSLVPEVTGPWDGEAPWACNFRDRVLLSEQLHSTVRACSIEQAVEDGIRAMDRQIDSERHQRSLRQAQSGDSLY